MGPVNISESKMTNIVSDDKPSIWVEEGAILIGVSKARKDETVKAGAKTAYDSWLDCVDHSQIASINPQNIERDRLQRRDSGTNHSRKISRTRTSDALLRGRWVESGFCFYQPLMSLSLTPEQVETSWIYDQWPSEKKSVSYILRIYWHLKNNTLPEW